MQLINQKPQKPISILIQNAQDQTKAKQEQETVRARTHANTEKKKKSIWHSVSMIVYDSYLLVGTSG